MKNILLIGGSYGIGLETARILSKNNKVFVASRSVGDLDTTLITHIPFDASADTLSETQLPEVLDGFVFCPGSINLKPFRALKPEQFASDFKTNFLDMVAALQAVLPMLKKSNQASVVLFSTVAVAQGMPFHTSVSASKGAIEGFAKAFAAEHAPQIRMNVIAPSLTQTPLAEKLLSSEDKVEKAAMRHPLKRIGQATDIAQATAFLLSEEASWITGQVIGVDGGLSNLKIG
ncbi:MAG: SDR family oxidoreductase [Flavobacteriaceae bacterium]|nr:SDR family oxidoreductase [Flavobacteriaceae bacterium]